MTRHRPATEPDYSDTEPADMLEIIARVSVVYVSLLVMLRVSGRRELAQLTPMDLLTMLLLSETVGPSMTGDDESIAAGLVAAATLWGASLALSWASFRFRRVRAITEGEAIVLIKDGRVDPSVMRAHRITDAELRAALHEQGLMAVSQVRRGFIEPGGTFTFVPGSKK